MTAAREFVAHPTGVLTTALAAVLMLGGCGMLGGDQAAPTSAPAPGPADAPAADGSPTAPDVDPSVLPEEQVAATPSMRLADGLAPPTNRWFSSLALGDAPQPVFPVPLAVALTAGGFAYGLPQVQVTGTSILGPFEPQVGLEVGAASAVVSAYDVASVTVELRDDAGEALGHLLLVEGSPVVRYTAAADQDVAMTAAFTAGDGRATTEVLDREHVLLGPGGADAPGAGLSDDGRVLTLAAGEQAAWFPVPDDASGDAVATLADAARAPVTGVTARYGVSGGSGGSVSTALTYATEGSGATAVVRMPHQRDSAGADCGLGTYATVHGTVDVCTASTLTWASPAVEPAGTLDLSGLTDGARAELADQVRTDAQARAEGRLEDPADTYYGGKALARDANLLGLAEGLALDDVAARVRSDLAERLRTWADPAGCESRAERCFVLDPVLRTVVGKAPAFGSEEANDHHFHYGYFLYAAGVVSAADPALAADLAPVVDLLAADVAAGGPVGGLPALRVFDAYAGHSWASGYAPFADGNNQESASEAVSAWNGLALWARARGDDRLEEQARWMLAAEAASARAYWTDFDTRDPAVEGFGHQVTSLVWGGKRDWATWFSAEPSAMLGILVLPVQPVAGYLGGDPDRVRSNLDEALAGPRDEPASWDVMFGDQLLMYAALAGTDDAVAALDVARDLPEERIDDGNTRAYLLAWLMAHASRPPR
ncbi:glycosyl hydrolase [Isoptericola sp. 4D.3]|uniref:glucan endo-1,3-beta-D-glucosidase n=1 Tax=Isoptericola peretonis TaxID=2918523 RepID=A0ABT0J747_9MICO|nr:glycosyl hydrolase [Isoptericola sp. 4D.3]